MSLSAPWPGPRACAQPCDLGLATEARRARRRAGLASVPAQAIKRGWAVVVGSVALKRRLGAFRYGWRVGKLAEPRSQPGAETLEPLL